MPDGALQPTAVPPLRYQQKEHTQGWLWHHPGPYSPLVVAPGFPEPTSPGAPPSPDYTPLASGDDEEHQPALTNNINSGLTDGLFIDGYYGSDIASHWRLRGGGGNKIADVFTRSLPQRGFFYCIELPSEAAIYSMEELRTFVASNKESLLREGQRNTYGGLLEIMETLKDTNVKSSDDFDDASIFAISAPATETRPAFPLVDEETERILIIFTCREFLRNFARTRSMPHGGFLSLDGKHKVNWNGYPVEPVCTVDASSPFQLEAMCIVSSESTEFCL
ncbi:hypothetical protein CYMTET_12274 [Cymbomonas tetramitiformis]|uniref:Uncharacterized protein n=1 Tax=Cymbomonas tetramitiformis TaxID=36881 RepID=A0AAE0LC83_9CHLO|nr:hypothetical protein CYMTET_12274 [Cymbomonas tetramitiformis]